MRVALCVPFTENTIVPFGAITSDLNTPENVLPDASRTAVARAFTRPDGLPAPSNTNALKVMRKWPSAVRVQAPYPGVDSERADRSIELDVTMPPPRANVYAAMNFPNPGPASVVPIQ